MNPPAAVEFTEVQRVLTLFAHAIAGRRLQLQALPVVATAGRLPLTTPDGVLIRLPARIARFARREHNRGAYRVALLHQIGYLENGSLDFDPRRGLSDLERRFAAAHRPALLRRVFVALEDLRVDAALLRCYPGAREDLLRAFADALAQRPPLATLPPAAAMVEALVRFSLGAARDDLLRDAPGPALSDALDRAAPLQQAAATVDDSARAALAICKLIEVSTRPLRPRLQAAPAVIAPADNGDALPSAGELEADAGAPDDGATSAVEFRGELPAGRVSQLARRGGHASPTASSPATIDADDSTAETPTADTSTGPIVPARAGTIGDAHIHYVDEWDWHRQAYLQGWCRVVEQRLQGDDFNFIHGVRRRHAVLASQVKRQFALIRPEQWQRIHRTDDGDELDLDAAIQARVDKRVGRIGDEPPYVRRDRARRDVAAVLLLDMSASTDHAVRDDTVVAATVAPAAAAEDARDEPADYLYGRYDRGDVSPPPPPQPKRRVIDIAKEALALMCDALQRLGDSHAVYGFSGAGRDNVEFHVAKDFDDTLSARTWAALAAMQPRGATRMGAAIRHATHKLARQPARMKVLIIVSDGYPQDQDYGPDRNDEGYGLHDTARALQEAERAGVAAFCLTIDPAGHDYLRRMCAPRRYQVIDDVRQLPRALSQVYRALTAGPG